MALTPTVIYNISDLQAIQNDLSGSYVLGANIDASVTATWNNGAGFVPLGNMVQSFSGQFDGNGYSISNLYINRPFSDEVGLFGSIGLTGSVQNVVLSSANVTGDLDTGALVGLNAGSITNSSAEGTVTGVIDVGGLVGENDGNISNSSSDASVVATIANGGGLVGGIYASSLTPTGVHSVTISNSYSTGNVFSANEPGGLVGGIYSAAIPGFDFRATIENTYSTGSVNGSTAGGLIGFVNPTGTAVTNSYWDTQTSGQSTSAAGTGLTTAQLQSGTLPNGFDPTVWFDIAGQFPELLWQAPATTGDQISPYIFANTVFDQTSNSAPLVPWFYFFSIGATFLTAGDYSAASASYPGPGSPQTLALIAPTRFDFDAPAFTSFSTLQAAYPFGTYTVTGAGSQISSTSSVSYQANYFTSTVPILANYSSLNRYDPANDFTVHHNSFTPDLHVTTGFTFLTIWNANTHQVVFQDGFQSPSSTTDLIPANTLSPNTNYTFELDFSDRLIVGASTQGFDMRTDGSFTTGPIFTNQPPVIDLPHSTTSRTINERPNVTGSLALDIANGAIAFTDADLNDRPTASVTHQTVTWQDSQGHAFQLTDDQVFKFENALLFVPEAGNTNNGKIDWGFTIADNALDFLGAGETITVTKTLEIDDGHGGKVDQDVKVTINGADDKPVALPDAATVQKGGTATGNAKANDYDPDTHDVLYISAVNGLDFNVGQAIQGAYGTLTLRADGSYSYMANTNLGAANGTGAVDTFTYRVDDGHGGQASSTLTLVVQSTTGIGNPHTVQPPPTLVGYPIAASDQVTPHEIVQGNRSDPGDSINDHGTRLAPIDNIPLQWAYDFKVAANKPVYAVAAGTVIDVYAGFSNGSSFYGYGNIVTIMSSVNGETLYTTYAHLDGLNNLPAGTTDPIADLYVGESVTAGQEIALSGSTGAPGAPHLHIQFGTQKYQAHLDTTDAKIDKSDPIGTIAAGSHDDVSPAYFQQLYIDFRTPLNSSDKIYDGTEGADYFVANTNGDTIVTYGGADIIVLDAVDKSGRQSNHIGLYGGSSIVDGNHELQLAVTYGVVPGRAGSITDLKDYAQGGFWGLSGAISEFGGLAPNTATSADMSVVKNFLAGAAAGGDILDFSVGAWGSGGINAAGGINHGLTAGDLFSHPASSATGVNAVIQLVQPERTVLPATDIIELGGTFADANAAVAAIHSGSDSFKFAAPLPNKDDAHMLVAYEDLSGNAHIMDVEFNNASGAATANSTLLTEHASDTVELTGVSLSSLTSDHFHLLV